MSSEAARLERNHVLCLGLAAAAVLFVDASVKELHGTAVFYASLVREIVEANDFLGIYTDDHAYLLKPPLAVWSSAAVAKILGLSNFAVTFPSRLAGLVCVLLCYVLVRRWWGHTIALIAAFALLTNSTFIQFTATFRMDALLLSGLLLSTVGWAYRESNWGAPALFAGITIAVLSKGPLGFAAIPLIGAHALLLREAPLRPDAWRWSFLLLPILLWYGGLALEHGLRPLSELGADALRASATPQHGQWQSIVAEYVVKPLRRYWPWLPFIGLGFVVCIRRSCDSQLPRAVRAHHAWAVLWATVVFAMAALKPDHDIRYLYLGLPALGLFAAISIDTLARQAFPRWLPLAVLGVVVFLVLWRTALPAPDADTRPRIAAINATLGARTDVLAIGGFPVPPLQARRQNTHRDWIHFYTGRVPRVMSWEQVYAESPDLSQGVFLTKSRGRQPHLEALRLVPKYTTKEMIFAVPQ